MILVDTNVWSETTRPVPDPAVLGWLSANADDVALASVTVAELLTGLAFLPHGRRRDDLTVLVEGLIARASGRIYDFDERAARAYATIRGSLRRLGREPSSPEDVMIAAIAAAHGFSVATRNVSHFDDTGVAVIDPWAAGS